MIATCKKLSCLAAVLLTLAMLLSLCAIPVFAEEAGTEAATEVATVADTSEGTEAVTSATTDKETSGTSETSKETTKVTETDTTDESIAAAEKKDRLTRGIINLGVGALLLVVLAILCIKFRNKIPGWWKALKSECGKIAWCSKDKLKKNTIVVVLIILLIVVAVAILDFVFSEGMGLLGKIFG